MRAILIWLLLLASPAFAYTQASRVWIAEFATTRAEAQAPMAGLPAAVHQPVLDISRANVTSANFATGTRYIRVVCEVPCQLKIGSNPGTSSLVLPAMRPEYFGVDAGAYISIKAVP